MTQNAKTQEDAIRVNDAIRAREVRLISEDGKQIGIVSIREALSEAEKSGLDLVEISPNAVPPVCKIIDYGKYNYEQQKREKINKKKQHVITVKEVRFRPHTDTHDIETKVRKIREFIENGDRVKLSVMFRGREMAHQEIGMETVQKVIALLEDVARIEKAPLQEGRFITAYLAAKK
ncbi:MAG: translation initiation factor IF-3 [Candidatus Marinimicrobia bacterium]|jgi:translation initiation factor IF-3|nr:translation initiation factor IF-3 [Candidatus Neomarinimicrobiota bacterium]MDD5709714.1 translation initiation factor IF-3 [Candidatus Neomarinimicrobiota bacterium]MDX9777903.1 translation initiation factor IF-3 [bacterium]